MRATYEDLLRVARRCAVEAHRIRHSDKDALINGWRSVLAATKAHLRWLRYDLPLVDESESSEVGPDTALRRLGRAIGAGADLLAAQDAYNAAALDNPAYLLAARAEVAEVALIAGRLVLRDLGALKRTTEYRRVVRMVGRLEAVVLEGRGSPGLGTLRNLTTSHPRYGSDDLSQLAWTAARWERAHLDIESHTLLTRDLRSITSQLRTAGGYTMHLAGCIAAAAQGVGLDPQSEVELGQLRVALLSFDAGASKVARSWQRRLSDISGQSGVPGEAAFLDLKATFDVILRPEGGRLSAQVLIPHRRQAVAALDALDEVVDAAARVARFQQFAVEDLIRRGALFIPRWDMASKILPYYSRRVVRLRAGRPWTRTDIAMYFSELTDALAGSAGDLEVAAGVARGLSGTTHHRRPLGDKYPRQLPPPFAAPRRPSAEITGSPDQGQEPVGPGR